MTKADVDKIVEAYKKFANDYIDAHTRYVEIYGYEVQEGEDGKEVVKGVLTFEDERDARAEFLREELMKLVEHE
jgi:hypothetical protein